jgi:hypothetical protein
VTTLVIHAPEWRVRAENAPSFRDVITSGVGEGFAIASTELPRIAPGCKVVVLDNHKKQRAEGILVRLKPTPPPNDRTPQGIRRYDVYIEQLRTVPYARVALNRRGIQVL